jgi:tRNA dimethylallyltransferase
MRYSPESPGLQAIGYRDAVAYLNGKINITELLKQLNTSTYKLAKRQMTWFRGDPRIQWISCGKGFNPEKIAKRIAQNIE